jgi:hypothetical protein
MMTSNAQTGSATIYQFPKRGRFAAGANEHAASNANVVSARAVSGVADDAWYHAEAIEADRQRTN